MNFAHPHFAEPRWLWLAAIGPLLLIVLQRYAGWMRKKQLAEIAAPAFLEELTRSHSPLRRALKNVLLLLAVAGICVVIAPPQWGEQAATSPSPGPDIGFFIELS